ncbi:MAG: glycosyltransferase family 2 protein [Candidatus Nitrosotenuis sp.]
MNKGHPMISIIVLNFNAGQLLLDCIESLLNTDYSNYEIIVVDNASKDNSHKKCKEKFNRIRLVENTENLGYCEGNNVGIREARGDFVVILNPDTLVEPGWLKELLTAFYEYGDGIYQPKFLTTTNRDVLMSAGNMIQLFGFGYSRGKGEKDTGQFENHEIVGYASGTCLFTSMKIMKKLGMFDPFLFAYHDDLDLCWRAALQGIKSHYVPRAVVYHPPEGFSFKWSPFKYYLLERNRQYCLLTHYSRSTLCKMLPALILVDVAVFFFYLGRGMVKQKIDASLNILKNWSKITRRYEQIQRERKIDDKTLIDSFTDKVYVPREVSNKKSNLVFNKFISSLSRLTRNFI